MNEKIKITMDIVNELRTLPPDRRTEWRDACLTKYPEMETVVNICYETAMK